MPKSSLLLLTALLTCSLLQAQTADSTKSPAQAPAQKGLPVPLPVPGGGAGLGPGGIPENPTPAPTRDETLKKAKENADQMADLQARRIATQLSLNTAQLNRIRDILIAREDELRKDFAPDAPVAKDHPLTAQERQTLINQVRQQALEKIGDVLNPQQKQQWDAMIAQQSANRSRRAVTPVRQRPLITPQAPATAPASSTPAAPAVSTAPASAPAPAAPPQSNH